MLFFIFFASKWNFKFIPLSLKIVTFIHLFFADFWVFHFLSFFCLFFFNFNFYFILLYNTVLVLPYIDMNQPQVYMSSQSWAPLPPPTPYHLSDLPRAPAPSILYPVSNIDCRFVSYLIVCMFQCHSPKSSHPLPLPQSLKVHSIHLCLFCCLT